MALSRLRRPLHGGFSQRKTECTHAAVQISHQLGRVGNSGQDPLYQALLPFDAGLQERIGRQCHQRFAQTNDRCPRLINGIIVPGNPRQIKALA